MSGLTDMFAVQEHAERPHVVQRLISEAHLLVQSAQQLEVRLDKDVTKLQVCPSCCMPAQAQYCTILAETTDGQSCPTSVAVHNT